MTVNLELRTLTPHVGAEVIGADLSRPLSPGERQFVLDAFQRHHLLVFRGQRLEPEQQLAFSELFGPYIDTHMKSPEDDRQYISNVVVGGAVGNGTLPFHSDHSFFPEPDTDAIMLYAIRVPATGGDTLFASAARAFSDLEPELKEQVCKLHALHSLGAVYAEKETLQAVHPLVWNEPRSGQPLLYVSQLVKRIVELSPAESDALIAKLLAHFYREELLYRHKWKNGDVVIWNNRVLQHARTLFDPSEERTLRRCTSGVPTRVAAMTLA